MRKTIILFAGFISMLSVQAQIDETPLADKKISYGLRSGYEFQANNSRLNYRLNLPYLGIWTDYKINAHWSLQFELNLRSETRVRDFNNGFRQTVDELYLTGPFLLKYHLNKKFKLYTGTQVLSASLKHDIFGIKKWNGLFGIEYHAIKNIYFDARYRQGLEKKTSKNNFRDNRISIGLGYKF